MSDERSSEVSEPDEAVTASVSSAFSPMQPGFPLAHVGGLGKGVIPSSTFGSLVDSKESSTHIRPAEGRQSPQGAGAAVAAAAATAADTAPGGLFLFEAPRDEGTAEHPATSPTAHSVNSASNSTRPGIPALQLPKNSGSGSGDISTLVKYVSSNSDATPHEDDGRLAYPVGSPAGSASVNTLPVYEGETSARMSQRERPAAVQTKFDLESAETSEGEEATASEPDPDADDSKPDADDDEDGGNASDDAATPEAAVGPRRSSLLKILEAAAATSSGPSGTSLSTGQQQGGSQQMLRPSDAVSDKKVKFDLGMSVYSNSAMSSESGALQPVSDPSAATHHFLVPVAAQRHSESEEEDENDGDEEVDVSFLSNAGKSLPLLRSMAAHDSSPRLAAGAYRHHKPRPGLISLVQSPDRDAARRGAEQGDERGPGMVTVSSQASKGSVRGSSPGCSAMANASFVSYGETSSGMEDVPRGKPAHTMRRTASGHSITSRAIASSPVTSQPLVRPGEASMSGLYLPPAPGGDALYTSEPDDGAPHLPSSSPLFSAAAPGGSISRPGIPSPPRRTRANTPLLSDFSLQGSVEEGAKRSASASGALSSSSSGGGGAGGAMRLDVLRQSAEWLTPQFIQDASHDELLDRLSGLLGIAHKPLHERLAVLEQVLGSRDLKEKSSTAGRGERRKRQPSQEQPTLSKQTSSSLPLPQPSPAATAATGRGASPAPDDEERSRRRMRKKRGSVTSPRTNLGRKASGGGGGGAASPVPEDAVSGVSTTTETTQSSSYAGPDSPATPGVGSHDIHAPQMRSQRRRGSRSFERGVVKKGSGTLASSAGGGGGSGGGGGGTSPSKPASVPSASDLLRSLKPDPLSDLTDADCASYEPLPVAAAFCSQKKDSVAGSRKRGLVVGLTYETMFGRGAGGVVSDLVLPADEVEEAAQKAVWMLRNGGVDVTVLLEKPEDPASAPTQPTRRNIESELDRLVAGSSAGDVFYLILIGRPGGLVGHTGLTPCDTRNAIPAARFEEAYCRVAKGSVLYVVSDLSPGASPTGLLRQTLVYNEGGCGDGGGGGGGGNRSIVPLTLSGGRLQGCGEGAALARDVGEKKGSYPRAFTEYHSEGLVVVVGLMRSPTVGGDDSFPEECAKGAGAAAAAASPRAVGVGAVTKSIVECVAVAPSPCLGTLLSTVRFWYARNVGPPPAASGDFTVTPFITSYHGIAAWKDYFLLHSKGIAVNSSHAAAPAARSTYPQRRPEQLSHPQQLQQQPQQLLLQPQQQQQQQTQQAFQQPTTTAVSAADFGHPSAFEGRSRTGSVSDNASASATPTPRQLSPRRGHRRSSSVDESSPYVLSPASPFGVGGSSFGVADPAAAPKRLVYQERNSLVIAVPAGGSPAAPTTSPADSLTISPYTALHPPHVAGGGAGSNSGGGAGTGTGAGAGGGGGGGGGLNASSSWSVMPPLRPEVGSGTPPTASGFAGVSPHSHSSPSPSVLTAPPLERTMTEPLPLSPTSLQALPAALQPASLPFALEPLKQQQQQQQQPQLAQQPLQMQPQPQPQPQPQAAFVSPAVAAVAPAAPATTIEAPPTYTSPPRARTDYFSESPYGQIAAGGTGGRPAAASSVTSATAAAAAVAATSTPKTLPGVPDYPLLPGASDYYPPLHASFGTHCSVPDGAATRTAPSCVSDTALLPAGLHPDSATTLSSHLDNLHASADAAAGAAEAAYPQTTAAPRPTTSVVRRAVKTPNASVATARVSRPFWELPANLDLDVMRREVRRKQRERERRLAVRDADVVAEEPSEAGGSDSDDESSSGSDTDVSISDISVATVQGPTTSPKRVRGGTAAAAAAAAERRELLLPVRAAAPPVQQRRRFW